MDCFATLTMTRYMHPSLKEFPSSFLEHLKNVIPRGLVSQVAEGFKEGHPTTFRINTLTSNASEVLKKLRQCDLEVTEFTEIPHTYILKKGSFKKLRESEMYEQGKIYLQSLSSQVPPLILNPQPGDKVLDMAAAPGGKTCQMAAMMNNTGELIALEPHPIRFEKLTHNLKKQGATFVTPFNLSGENFSKIFLDNILQNNENIHRFEKILLDAPCSGEGTFLINDPPSYRHWSHEFVKKQAVVQKQLLTAAWELLKPNGILVYSTCALSPEENEEVIEYGIKNLPGFKVEEINLRSSYLKVPLTSWQGNSFSPAVAKCRRIYPSKLFEGFFVAKISKGI